MSERGGMTECHSSEFPYDPSLILFRVLQKRFHLESVLSFIFIPDESLLGLLFGHEQIEGKKEHLYWK